MREALELFNPDFSSHLSRARMIIGNLANNGVENHCKYFEKLI